MEHIPVLPNGRLFIVWGFTVNVRERDAWWTAKGQTLQA